MGNRADDDSTPIRRAPPRNEIVPEKLGNRLRSDMTDIGLNQGRMEAKIDGIILDLDVTASEVMLSRHEAQSQARWNFIRDLMVILMLLLGTAMLAFRIYQMNHEGVICRILNVQG